MVFEEFVKKMKNDRSAQHGKPSLVCGGTGELFSASSVNSNCISYQP